jgi:DNA-binding IclR family transcriptional regulator
MATALAAVPTVAWNAPARPATAPDQEGVLVKSGARSLQVLEFFLQHGEPARTAEIGRYLGIPNSSADELLRTLAQLGYVAFNPRTKCYAPSYRLFGLGKGLETRFFHEGRIGQLMTELADATGETVVLAGENRHQLQLMTAVRRNWDDPVRLADGRRRNLLTRTARDWRPADNFSAAILAAMPDLAAIELARRYARESGTPVRIGDLEAMVTTVHKVRQRSLAVCRRGASGLDSLAMALPADTANVQMAIGIVGDDLFDRPEREAQLSRSLRLAVERFRPR